MRSLEMLACAAGMGTIAKPLAHEIHWKMEFYFVP
jgi:hypothetical protein